MDAITMWRLKSEKSGRFKTGRPKASPRALYGRSAIGLLFEKTLLVKGLMLRQSPLFNSRLVQWLPLSRSGT